MAANYLSWRHTGRYFWTASTWIGKGRKSETRLGTGSFTEHIQEITRKNKVAKGWSWLSESKFIWQLLQACQETVWHEWCCDIMEKDLCYVSWDGQQFRWPRMDKRWSTKDVKFRRRCNRQSTCLNCGKFWHKNWRIRLELGRRATSLPSWQQINNGVIRIRERKGSTRMCYIENLQGI